jgi:plasmid replication initiation protein
MNEAVKYHNDLNLVKFNNFNPIELDIFFAVCQQMRLKNLSEITLSFEKLRELTNYTSTSRERFITDINSTYRKLLETTMPIITKSKIIRFVLFTKYEIDLINDKVTIKTNKEFEYILNIINGNFTRFELEEFVNIRRANSKTIYKHLKQFRSTGIWRVDYDEFLVIIGMSDEKIKSTDKTKEINRILKDLAPLFRGLNLEKVKKGNKATGKIQKLIWRFQAEKQHEIERVILDTKEQSNTFHEYHDHPNQAKLEF